MRTRLIPLLLLAPLLPLGAAEASAPCVPALTDRCETWASTYDGPAGGNDSAEDIAISPDGTRLFAAGSRTMGSSLETGNDFDYSVVALDAATGGRLWVGGYDGPGAPGGASDDIALDVEPGAGGGRVYVTGITRGDGGAIDYDYATVAFDAASGTRLWARRAGGVPGAWDQAEELAVGTVSGADGDQRELVFVSGWSSPEDGGRTGLVVGYDGETGEELWRAVVTATAELRGLAFVPRPRPDGSVGGRVIVAGNGFDAVAYDAETGEEVWTTDTEVDGYAWKMVASPEGDLVVATGFTFFLDLNLGSSIDLQTIAYDVETGEVLWQRRYQGPADSVGWSIAMAPDGERVYSIAYTSAETPRTRGVVAAYDARTGQEAWVTLQDGIGGQTSFTPWSVMVSPDSNDVFVAGYSPFTVIRYRADTGSREWAARYTPPGAFDGAYALAAAPDGSRVFAAGGHTRPTSPGSTDALVAAYDV